MNKRTWSIENLKEAVSASTEISDVVIKLGLRAAGGNFATIRRVIKEENIDISHFKSKSSLNFKKTQNANKYWRIPPEEVYTINPHYRGKIRIRLLTDNIIPYVCAGCGNSGFYNGAKLTLQIDHINGIHHDNRIENLRWMCPNCHTQTMNFAGRNKRKRTVLTQSPKKENSLVRKRIVDYDKVIEMIKISTNLSEVAREFKVSPALIYKIKRKYINTRE